jgi:PAS domain S-box-containing protein
MNSFFNKFFKESMLGIVFLVTFVMIIGLSYLIPSFIKEQAFKDAYDESDRLTNYLRMFRSYYTSDILKKVKEHTDLQANFDHKTQEKVIPLPATLVHDLGERFTEETDISIQMYSNYPFPNRASRKLDSYQKDALAYILKNPGEAFSKEDTVDGQLTYRTAFGDYLFDASCVTCHNTRADTPKNDWKLGDMRGVIEVSIPIHVDKISSQGLTSKVLLFILVNFLFLALYYFLQIKMKNEKLQNAVSNKDKILSEYKRAVDAGAIVSKTNSKGLITYVNDAFVQISGYSKKELLGKRHSIVRHPQTSSEVFKEMWENLLNKKIWQGDLKNRKKDGTSYYVYGTIVPILDEKDSIVEFLAIRYDTTILHEAISRATLAEKAKGSFLANMSHELRTPLNAIIGFSQILEKRNKLEDKDKVYVEKIQLSGRNLLALVDSILDFSKIEEGKMEFYPTDINIETLFDEINILLETQANDKKINIIRDGFENTHPLFADKQLLKQAFINILSNAIKFTPEHGEIKIHYQYKDSLHHFSICDNGIGISQADLKELFYPFKQGDGARETLAKGTGLGLAITKKIITELHKGSISVESALGKGSCFKVSL